MGDPAKRRATYEDLLAVPEHLVAEIIGGELRTRPRPASRHARAASRLGMGLGTLEAYRLDGGWRLLGTWRDDAIVRVEPFDAIELELGALWAR
jgi:hypothetical protein